MRVSKVRWRGLEPPRPIQVTRPSTTQTVGKYVK
jgi:hypothetical protein